MEEGMEEGVGRTGQGCVIVFSISSRADWGVHRGALWFALSTPVESNLVNRFFYPPPRQETIPF